MKCESLKQYLNPEDSQQLSQRVMQEPATAPGLV